MWDFISERLGVTAFLTHQHFSLVVQAVLVATVIAVLLAVVVNRVSKLDPVANTFSAVGLTLHPSP